MKPNNFYIVFFLLLLMFASCVKDKVYIGAATIENVSFLPESPKSTDDVVITARVTDLREVSSVNVFYRTLSTGAFTSIATVASGFLYSATIPALPMGTKVEYYIEAKNSGGFTTVYPSAAPNQLANYTVGASNVIKLYINEVFADGTKDATDPDWVEIYNDSDLPVDLSGYAFYDDGIKISGGTKPKRLLNAGTIVQAKGFLVLKTEYTGGEYAVEFGLSTSGDGAYLENTNGIIIASLDFLNINLSGKKSYGRQPDGSSTLTIFNSPTRGTSNN